jgi:hypothetical protein
MDEASTANPLFVVFFFVVRCLLPLLIMLGITYLLKRLGLIAESPPPPPDENNDNPRPSNEQPATSEPLSNNHNEGGLAHV